jgi:hypothetical protein
VYLERQVLHISKQVGAQNKTLICCYRMNQKLFKLMQYWLQYSRKAERLQSTWVFGFSWISQPVLHQFKYFLICPITVYQGFFFWAPTGFNMCKSWCAKYTKVNFKLQQHYIRVSIFKAASAYHFGLTSVWQFRDIMMVTWVCNRCYELDMVILRLDFCASLQSYIQVVKFISCHSFILKFYIIYILPCTYNKNK